MALLDLLIDHLFNSTKQRPFLGCNNTVKALSLVKQKTEFPGRTKTNDGIGNRISQVISVAS